jgi:hypothetical protein
MPNTVTISAPIWGEQRWSRRELMRAGAFVIAGGCALTAGLSQLESIGGSVGSPTLVRSTFEPLVGERFGLSSSGSGPGPDGLELFKVRPLRFGPTAAQPGGQDSFSLLFRGPLADSLEQGVYTLEHHRVGELAVFLVPMWPEHDALYYEGVFNRSVPN